MKNKKAILLELLLFIFFPLITTSLSAQICTKGVVDCKGECGRFTDKDGDGICDFSPRSTPVEKTVEKTKDTINKSVTTQMPKTVKEATSKTPKAITEKEQITKKIESKKEGNIDTIASVIPPATINKEASNNNPIIKPQSDAKPNNNHKHRYPLIEISILTIGLYLVSMLLVKFNLWKKQTHRKIWNFILLVTFLMSGILGFFLVVQINYHILMDMFHLFVKLHILFGIAMAIISVIHIWWHLSYFTKIFKRKI